MGYFFFFSKLAIFLFYSKFTQTQIRHKRWMDVFLLQRCSAYSIEYTRTRWEIENNTSILRRIYCFNAKMENYFLRIFRRSENIGKKNENDFIVCLKCYRWTYTIDIIILLRSTWAASESLRYRKCRTNYVDGISRRFSGNSAQLGISNVLCSIQRERSTIHTGRCEIPTGIQLTVL